MKVLAFGDIVWDVYPDKRCLGGAPLNFAAHLAALGERAYILSAVGADSLGEETVQQVKAWGVSDDFLHVSPCLPTGKCTVSLDAQGVPHYVHGRDTAYDHIPCETVPDEFDVLYFGTLCLRSGDNFQSLQTLLSTHHFCEVFVDLNLRAPFYEGKTVRFAVENATILKISDEELPTVATLLNMTTEEGVDGFARALAARFEGLKCVIITRAAAGAYVLDCADGTEQTCQAVKTEVVSTVGAGDSFCAAFLHRFRQGAKLDRCLEYASKIAGFVVSQYDAVPSYTADMFA